MKALQLLPVCWPATVEDGRHRSRLDGEGRHGADWCQHCFVDCAAVFWFLGHFITRYWVSLQTSLASCLAGQSLLSVQADHVVCDVSSPRVLAANWLPMGETVASLGRTSQSPGRHTGPGRWCSAGLRPWEFSKTIYYLGPPCSPLPQKECVKWFGPEC